MSDKTLNVDIEVIYYWYDDEKVLEETGKKEIIERAINEGDYSTFMLFYHSLNKGFNCFLPPVADLIYNDELIGHVNITNKTGFNMITLSRYNGDKYNDY